MTVLPNCCSDTSWSHCLHVYLQDLRIYLKGVEGKSLRNYISTRLHGVMIPEDSPHGDSITDFSPL